MRFYDAVVIGGGLSGIVTALELNKRGVKCAILEAKDRIGKKFLHLEAVEKYNYNVLKNYYCALGILLKEDDEGRVYPYSESANTILNVLLYELKKNNVDVLTQTKAISIEKKDSFIIKTTNGDIKTNRVILATGSDASFGINSHAILANLGHNVTKLKQTLVPIKSDGIIGANGVRSKAKLSLYINNKEVFSENGELLFKDGAISGILAFKASTFIAREMVNSNIDKVDAYAEIDFMPEYTEDEIRNIINSSPLENPLLGLMHKAIAANISKEKDLSYAIKHYKCNIDGLTNLESAQVTSGGLDISQFDNKTYESKIVKGLYAIGEVLDVDGECGGYNLSFALMSALACVDEITKC